MAVGAVVIDSEPLSGKVAIVTGGAAGIGGGCSRLLALAGATVVVNDVDGDLLEATMAEIARAGARAVPVLGDIRDATTVHALVERALAVTGRIDVLVNNVGDYRPARGTFARTTEDDWHAIYAINLEHVFRCTHAVLPTMRGQGAGSIVNVSTVEALRGIPSMPVYSAMNAGIIAFTRSLAVEAGRYGVRVNAIAPDMADTLQTPADSMLRGRDPALVRSWIPLGRFGAPDDYAQVVLFLATDQSRFVTGVTIPVDGGTLAASGWYGRADGKGWTNLPDHP